MQVNYVLFTLVAYNIVILHILVHKIETACLMTKNKYFGATLINIAKFFLTLCFLLFLYFAFILLLRSAKSSRSISSFFFVVVDKNRTMCVCVCEPHTKEICYYYKKIFAYILCLRRKKKRKTCMQANVCTSIHIRFFEIIARYIRKYMRTIKEVNFF